MTKKQELQRLFDEYEQDMKGWKFCYEQAIPRLLTHQPDT